jgi:peptidoglycan-associated lipoprotein
MTHRKNWWRLASLAALTAAVMMTAGCAKKSVQAPPVTNETPPNTPPKEPEKTADTTPTPSTTPSSHVLAASDLQPVFFDFDSFTLRDDARSTLDANARLLRDNATAKIVIEGHCDERGTVEYNQALGERRAQAARDYLVQAGITESRVQTLSYGKERAFEPGHDEAAWAKNRRAHFTLQ